MEIVIVVLLLLIIAALVFAWMKFRPGAPGGAGGPPDHAGGGVRGRRRTAVAARHDPMAEAVERHSMATDPHEAAEAELRLQAQANRVAADLHTRQASALESETQGAGGRGQALPAHDYEQAPSGDGRPLYEDEDGRPVYEDGRPVYRDDSPR